MPTSLKLKLLFRSPPFRLFAISVVALILLYSWNNLYYNAKQAELKELQQKLDTATQQLERAKTARASLPALVNQQHNLAASLTRYEGALPENLDPPSLLRRLTGFAEAAGVTLNKIEHYKATTELKGMRPYGLRLDTSGRFPALVRFLAHIDGDPQFLLVDPPSFRLTADGKVVTTLQIVALYKGGAP